MAPTFPQYYRDETTLTVTNTTAVDSTTPFRSIFYYPRERTYRKENAFEKKRRLETKQQKRDRISLDIQKQNRFQFNELKPKIKTIVTKPKMSMR